MKLTIFLLLSIAVSGCATMGASGIGECRKLCQNEKVDFFKDEVIECQCHVSVGAE